MKKFTIISLAVTAAFLFSTKSFGQTWNIPSSGSTSAGYIGTTSADDVTINAGGPSAEKVRIGSNGGINVGLGYDFPTSGSRFTVQLKTSGMYSAGTAASFLLNSSNSSSSSIIPEYRVNINNKGPFAGTGFINAAAYNSSNSTWDYRFYVAYNGSAYFGSWTSPVTATTPMLTVPGGFVTIGSGLTTPAGYRLYVQDGILTEKIKVATSGTTNWSDFVFAPGYKLTPLLELEAYIKKNHHLPEIPSTEEVNKEGVDLLEMDAKLLQKVEELTLYMIEMKKTMDAQQQEIEALKKKNQELERKVLIK